MSGRSSTPRLSISASGNSGGALLYGGRLVVVPYLQSRSPEEFLQLLSNEKVTVLNQTPSAFRQLIAAEDAAPRLPEFSLRLTLFSAAKLF